MVKCDANQENLPDTIYSKIFYAIKDDRLKCLKSILSNIDEENPSVIINNGDIAGLQYCLDFSLLRAAQLGMLNIVRYLMEKTEADINVENGWALNWAVKGKYYEIVKYLVEKGINVNAFHERALTSAIKNSDVLMVQYLIEHGADPAYLKADYHDKVKILREF
jgi:ankyrin repeat protein